MSSWELSAVISWYTMVRWTLLTAGATPLPVKPTVTLGRDASLLAIAREAEAAPARKGAKRTVTSLDLPAATVNAAAGETTVKAGLIRVIERTARSAVPVLPIANFKSLVWPMATLPKSTEAGTTE